MQALFQPYAAEQPTHTAIAQVDLYAPDLILVHRRGIWPVRRLSGVGDGLIRAGYRPAGGCTGRYDPREGEEALAMPN